MTTFQGVIFVALLVMVLVWFYCIHRLKLQLLQRHPDTHEEMGLSDLWRDGNARPTLALLRFLFRSEYEDLDDPEITSLSVFMRWFFVAYVAIFGYLAFTLIRQGQEEASDQRIEALSSSSSPSSSAEDRRQAAYDLHRDLKWPQAIAAYDALLREQGADAEILYWRGMAYWKSARFDDALRDFRRVIELEPTHLEAHQNADRLLSRQQRWDEILAMWDQYIARQPRDAEAYFERGGTHFHNRNMAAARADAKRACELGKAQACTMVERLKDK